MNGLAGIIFADLLTDFLIFSFTSSSVNSTRILSSILVLLIYLYLQNPFCTFCYLVCLTDPVSDHPKNMGAVRNERYLIPPLPQDLLIDHIPFQRLCPAFCMHTESIARLTRTNLQSMVYGIIIKPFCTLLLRNYLLFIRKT